VPFLDLLPLGKVIYTSFNDYWNKTILRDTQGNDFSRKDIVLYVTNQDGGAHVDPKIDALYRELTRNNSLGYRKTADKISWQGYKGAELAVIRQIGHEILRTFLSESEYPFKKPKAMMMGGGGVQSSIISDES
jgi:hypothetical protein